MVTDRNRIWLVIIMSLGSLVCSVVCFLDEFSQPPRSPGAVMSFHVRMPSPISLPPPGRPPERNRRPTANGQAQRFFDLISYITNSKQ